MGNDKYVENKEGRLYNGGLVFGERKKQKKSRV